METGFPLSRDIVLIGGGHAHALVLRAWGMDPLPGARLTLINPGPTAPYTGMLPGFVAGHYTRDALEIDLVRLARFAGARMIFGRATAIDRDARRIEVPGRAPVAYDIASLDIGITSDMPDLPGFAEHGIAAKPLGPFALRWQSHLEQGGGPVVVIGGGVAGVELALAMHHAMSGASPVTIVEAEQALRGVNAGTDAKLRAALSDAGIQLIEGKTVSNVGPSEVELSDGTTLPASLTVGAAGARPFDWLAETGLTLENGYVAVGADLLSTNDPNIFAVGDCAHLSASPRPKAGVFAVRAAPVLTHNLKALASGRALKPFKPQAHYLKLISLGGKSAIADRRNQSPSGAWAWRWKDWIDQRFMTRLNAVPDMTVKTPAIHASGADDTPMLCAGCGSKVGGNALDTVLAELPQPPRDDVLTGPGDDAAVLRVGGRGQCLTTDNLRAFWEDPWVFGRIAALHALGDIWAMGAAPQAALAQITLPRATPELQSRWLTEVMAAASKVFHAESAAIVGGHTMQGAEFSVGFSVTGLLPDDGSLSGIPQDGDVLVLTRPIGSGTVLAAEMRGVAQGEDVAHILRVMATSQGNTARVLARHASAMTDVTGFGLAGHAARLARPAGLSVVLDTQEIPLYPGAEALAEAGIRSSLWQDNRDALRFEGPETARTALLFDPQTAGGFLAAMPRDAASTTLAEIEAGGGSATIVGTLTSGEDAEVIAR